MYDTLSKSKFSSSDSFLICRTDGIGDVVLTLPLAGFLKQIFPSAKIGFLVQEYTAAITRACSFIDETIIWQPPSSQNSLYEQCVQQCAQYSTVVHVFPRKDVLQMSKHAQIPVRISSRNRWYSWIYANKLIQISRKNSPKHEAELNFDLIAPLLPNDFSLPSTSEISSLYGLKPSAPIRERIASLFSSDKQHIVLHPLSAGSAREWSLENYANLVQFFPEDSYTIFITGSTSEREKLISWADTLPQNVHLVAGEMSLPELLSFLQKCNGIIAGSTGPLHIAAALGIKSLGIFPPMRPMHPGRWKPIGKHAGYLVHDETNTSCASCANTLRCVCVLSISPRQVFEKFQTL